MACSDCYDIGGHKKAPRDGGAFEKFACSRTYSLMRPQHCLYFLPEPQLQGSLRPTLAMGRRLGRLSLSLPSLGAPWERPADPDEAALSLALLATQTPTQSLPARQPDKQLLGVCDGTRAQQNPAQLDNCPAHQTANHDTGKQDTLFRPTPATKAHSDADNGPKEPPLGHWHEKAPTERPKSDA